MQLEDLIGPHKLTYAARTDIKHPFDYDKDCIVWGMDGKIYMAIEDINDGYRSSLGLIFVADGDMYELSSYPEFINRNVIVRHVTKSEYYGVSDIVEFIDIETGHLWMRLGTDNIDDYYPSFIAQWYPMENK